MIQFWRVPWNLLQSFQRTEIVAVSFLLNHVLRWVDPMMAYGYATISVSLLWSLQQGANVLSLVLSLLCSLHTGLQHLCVTILFHLAENREDKRYSGCTIHPHVVGVSSITCYYQFSWGMEATSFACEKLLSGPWSEKVYRCTYCTSCGLMSITTIWQSGKWCVGENGCQQWCTWPRIMGHCRRLLLDGGQLGMWSIY